MGEIEEKIKEGWREGRSEKKNGRKQKSNTKEEGERVERERGR